MRTAAALVAAAGVWAGASDAFGQGRSADRWEASRSPQIAAGRYLAANGTAFVLVPENGHLLLKFEDRGEIWALKPSPGARGDRVYRDDVGRDVIRATRLGGLVLFTPDRPTGTPAALERKAAGLSVRPMAAGALLRQLAQASSRASKAARRLIAFEAPNVTPGSEPLFADAAQLAADGLIVAAQSDAGRRRLARVKLVRLLTGPQAGVRMNGTALEVSIAPARSLAGRPSSQRTAQLLTTGS